MHRYNVLGRARKSATQLSFGASDQRRFIMNLLVRRSIESDNESISDVVMAAFGNVQGHELSDLVADLMLDSSAQPLLSLVMTADDNVVGHILFTSTKIHDSPRMVSSAILAPLSVQPEFQNRFYCRIAFG